MDKERFYNDIKTIDFSKKEIEETESGKYLITNVHVPGIGFLHQYYFDRSNFSRSIEILLYDGQEILRTSIFKSKYDSRIFEMTENEAFEIKGFDWSETKYQNFMEFLNEFQVFE